MKVGAADVGANSDLSVCLLCDSEHQSFMLWIIQGPHSKKDATMKSKQAAGVTYAQQAGSQCLMSLEALLITSVSFMPGLGKESNVPTVAGLCQ